MHMFNLGNEEDRIACKLGNFYASPFTIDGLLCGSIEGFIQSLKFSDEQKKRLIAGLAGKAAKFAGKKAGKRLSREPVVFWHGRQIPFRSSEHMALIERGIREKFAASEACREALLLTGDAMLVHDTGFQESRFTSLKSEELVRIVSEIRLELQQQ